MKKVRRCGHLERTARLNEQVPAIAALEIGSNAKSNPPLNGMHPVVRPPHGRADVADKFTQSAQA
jgi:hypothetical protein